MSDLLGKSLGRYHILDRLGEGGMATVYKASDSNLEREVAVKIIFPSKQQNEKTLKRFEREAKALAQLSHPNIVKVLDFGEQGGLHYLVMEYLRGGTLKTRLGHPIPYREAARLLLPIAQALKFSHQRGIIHRDVKPSNLLFSETEELMLSDFGIAKILNSGDGLRLTSTNMTIGTPDYMAPEQIHSKDVDHRVDIYSLGAVLYEMLTGRKPFTAKTPMAVLVKSTSEPLPSPRLFISDLPDYIEDALLKALAKKPEDRFANMEFLASVMREMAEAQESGHHPAFPQNSIEDPEKTVDVLDIKEVANQLPDPHIMASAKKLAAQSNTLVCPFCHQPTTGNNWTCSNCGRNLESVVLVMKRRK